MGPRIAHDLEEERTQVRPRPGAALVEGTAPQLTTETQSLLRSRLRAVALILLVASVLFILRGLLLPEAPLDALGYAELVLTGACFALLSSRWTLGLRQLRAVELLLFGAMLFFLMAFLHSMLTRAGVEQDPLLALGAMRNGVLHAFALTVVYGLFIPGSWRRTLLVVLPFAVAPPVVGWYVGSRYEMVGRVLGREGMTAQATNTAIPLIIGVLIATYGAHIVNSLRREAFEARRFGQYVLKRELGSGGMGEVYLAEHQLLKRPCAIKVISPSKAADPTALARFEREVQSAARLSHWNTVEIYDYGRTTDGTFYYVMERLRGLSLDQLVKVHGPQQPERVVHLLRQVCRALREAHAMGLVHRDIKPGNIFTAELGGTLDVAKLLDFGLVKPVDTRGEPELTRDNVVMGSPMFMAPEQALSSDADARSDIYALGGVAYFLLAGEPPFVRDSMMKVLVAHVHEDPKPISRLRPDVPEDLEAIIVRCMAKRPEDRYQDVNELNRALGTCSVAGKWTGAAAARWWAENAPGALVVA